MKSWIVLTLLLASCASSGNEPSQEVFLTPQSKNTTYKKTLELSVCPSSVLPCENVYSLEEVDAELKTTTTFQVLTWDINRDGRVDMLEVRDQDGTPLAQYFDFDFDGIVDEKRYFSKQ